MMFTSDELNLAKDIWTSDRQLNIDCTKFSPKQVDREFFHCCLTAKYRYWKKTNSRDSMISHVYTSYRSNVLNAEAVHFRITLI